MGLGWCCLHNIHIIWGASSDLCARRSEVVTKMEKEKVETPLLLKKYYENCPGCKVDQAKELKKDVSFVNLSLIWLVVLSASKRFNSFPNFSSRVLLFFSANFCSCSIYSTTFKLCHDVKWLQDLPKLNYSAISEIFHLFI